MLDVIELDIKAGKGGNGSISFIHERSRPLGGPDGGDGGWGGSILITAQSNLRSLDHLVGRPEVVADSGLPGKSANRTGKNGKSLRITVPVGTVVHEVSETDSIIVSDLVSDGMSVIIAAGGDPGRGNLHFVSSTNQEPLLAEAGSLGAAQRIRLEVKILSDVAIIGVPNAGKSTLLSRLSKARPKVADYPFTTLEPNLGVLEGYGRSLVLLDIPGLIEGAHTGKGLGLDFLRHVERVRVILHLLDGTDPNLIESYRLIEHEVEAHAAELMDKPRVLAVSKMDVPDARDNFELLSDDLNHATRLLPIPISSVTGEGINELADALLISMPEVPSTAISEEPIVFDRERPRYGPPRVRLDNGVFIVEHKGLERIVEVSNLSNWTTRMQLHRELGRIGVIKALEAAGVNSGDTVKIGVAELEWQ